MAKTKDRVMGVHVAFSDAQLRYIGVPPEMTEDDLAECLDRALLEDCQALQIEVQQWIEDRYDNPAEMR